LLADWGADVVKIEPPTGDPARGPGSLTVGGDQPVNPRFEVHNRSRRGVALDLKHPAGRAVADRLLENADVLVTNLSPGALERLGLEADAVCRRHPRLVYAQISGYDLATPKANDRSYDHGAYWSYSGAADLFTGVDGEPPQPTGGFGDRAAGSVLAGAICAALLARERTGRGGHVTTSLVNTGMWLMASDVSDILTSGTTHRLADRREAGIPTLNCYRTADGHWLWLQVMTPERDWYQLLDALDAPWLDEDPRFHGGQATTAAPVRASLVELLDEVFRTRTLAEWDKRLSAHGVTWAPVRRLEDTVNDETIRASSAFIEVVHDDGSRHLSVNTPCGFNQPAGGDGVIATGAPRIGEHTEQVLESCGVTAAEQVELRREGVIGSHEQIGGR
jgi:crotonobetainyl-CoA:carnitine CoA-transferase CaiB-like acyl-CoA transferase